MREQMQAVGRVGTIQVGALRVRVTVIEAKRAYGHVRYLVTPVAGGGEQWMQAIVFEA